jgi:hypothetical protein
VRAPRGSGRHTQQALNLTFYLPLRFDLKEKEAAGTLSGVTELHFFYGMMVPGKGLSPSFLNFLCLPFSISFANCSLADLFFRTPLH